MTQFATIRTRAEARKGGAEALQALLPLMAGHAALNAMSDDRILAEMTQRVFCSGFVWRVIDQKWPGFEAAFLGFDPLLLLAQPPEFWDGLTSDTRIVRNGAKIMTVAHNARFITDIATEHGSFARFLVDWPKGDQAGLLTVLGKRGTRLGGMTGQYFLRFIGWDAYMLSQDVVACLRDSGLDIAENPTSKRDQAAIQARFNDWHAETGLSYTHLSRICAMSIGENAPPEVIARYVDLNEA